MTGKIFDIQRNSLVDGPGVRTTVFFKVCNLKCAWCHNPESRSAKKQMLFYENRCTSCGKCREVCPNALKSCDFCGKCEFYCPVNARKICGRDMTADEVFAEIIADKDFFDAFGGGVTFSGGECMLQADFLLELLIKCKNGGIHTAIDTAGNVPWSSFEKILPYGDLFLYDVKSMDGAKHAQYTGADNKIILENLKKLRKAGREIIVRVPIIPEFNGSEREISQIISFARGLGVKKIELLPYHAMGEQKWEAIGETAIKFSAPSKQEMEKYNRLVEE